MTLTPDWNISNPVTYARMRQTMMDGALQEGVVGANDLKVAQRGAGANMSVDVPAGAAWVQIDTGTRNGLGHVYNDATANVTVTASNGTNPRIDQIILRWNDSSIPTGSGNVPTLEVLTGTATVGATLDNRTGAAALPNDCLRLADLLIPTSSTSVTTANIRDRRPWARGAEASVTVGVSGGAGVTIPVNAALQSFGAAYQQRVEITSPLVRFTIDYESVAYAAGNTFLGVLMDGTMLRQLLLYDPTAARFTSYATTFVVSGIALGSHLFVPGSKTSATASNVNPPITFTIEEIVRSNGNNGIT